MKSLVFCTFDTTNNELQKGSFNDIPLFCSMNKSSERCINFYKEIHKIKEGFNICPNGFACYKTYDIIFTCLRIVGYNDDKVKRKISGSEKIYSYKKNEVLSYINNINNDIEEYSKLSRDSEFLGGLIHDYRKYNLMKLNISNVLAEKTMYNPKRTIKYKEIKNYVYGYQALANISKARLDTYEHLHSDKNDSIYDNQPVQLNVFKTFDKLRHCGKLINQKQVHIILDADETIPDIIISREIETAFYLLIDNAIKYTEENYDINIKINILSNNIQIQIESIGPYNSPEEIPNIFNKGFRGKKAKEVEKNGQGIGLYTTKKICDRNNISILASSQDKKIILRENDYSIFKVVLKIPITNK